MKNLFLIALTSFFLSCSSDVEKPVDLIPEPEMVAIITDIHTLEAKLSRLRVKNDSLRKVYNAFERELFKEHGTTKEVYERSYAYYISVPERLEAIYEIAVDSLNVIEQRMTVEQNKAREVANAKPEVSKKKANSDTTAKVKPDSLKLVKKTPARKGDKLEKD